MDTPEPAAAGGDSLADPRPDAKRPQVADYTGDWPGRAVFLIATLRDRLGNGPSGSSTSAARPSPAWRPRMFSIFRSA